MFFIRYNGGTGGETRPRRLDGVGCAASVNTMCDLIVDALAALAVSVVGYFSTIRRRESTNSERQEASA